MGNRVDRVRAEVSETQLAQAVLEAWKELFGDTPSKESVALVLAQNALETGNRKAMWNFNVGNITTNENSQYDYFDTLKTNEQVRPGVWEKKNLKYRAYPSLKEGVKDYLKLLSGKYYSAAWQHIVNPDPAAFSKALKQKGYYTANEKPYTDAISNLYGKFNKSNSYENAVAGNVEPVNGEGKSTQVAVNTTSQSKVNGLFDVIEKYWTKVFATERLNKKLYKQYLPNNDIVIKIAANSYTDAVEFSNVLCVALDEELMAEAFIHTDNKNIEVQCCIFGPKLDCFNTVKQLTKSLSLDFKNATSKLGGIDIETDFIMNKKSSYQEITLKVAEAQHRKFLFKIIQG